jgi:hypothetical protein
VYFEGITCYAHAHGYGYGVVRYLP